MDKSLRDLCYTSTNSIDVKLCPQHQDIKPTSHPLLIFLSDKFFLDFYGSSWYNIAKLIIWLPFEREERPRLVSCRNKKQELRRASPNGKAADLKSAGSNPMGVRIPRPPGFLRRGKRDDLQLTIDD